MSDLFNEFVRKQFSVTAVRVDPLNIEEVAKACRGQIMHDGDKEEHFSRDYIKVRVILPLHDEQTKARIGDWVVRQGRTFKVYKDAAFRKTFEHRDGSSVVSDHQKNQTKKQLEEERKNHPKPKAPSPADIPAKKTSEVPESLKEEQVKKAPVQVKIEEVKNAPKPITLDELNSQPGDPRTANDIHREG